MNHHIPCATSGYVRLRQLRFYFLKCYSNPPYIPDADNSKMSYTPNNVLAAAHSYFFLFIYIFLISEETPFSLQPHQPIMYQYFGRLMNQL